MKTLMLLMIFTFTTSIAFCQTEREMDNNRVKEYKDADKKLNEVYEEILSIYKGNSVFIENLTKAQKLWVQFRAAQLAMKYPPQRGAGYYGSVQPMCEAIYLTKLTNQRIKELQEWSKKSDEGEVCNGTVGEYQQ